MYSIENIGYFSIGVIFATESEHNHFLLTQIGHQMKFKAILIGSVFFMSSLANVANAGLLEFNWNWTGTSGYTATGTMGYSDTLENTGVITAGSIDTFSMEAFSGVTSLFTWDLATGTQNNPFQLSFDTTLEKLVIGGFWPTATDSIVWGNDSDSGGSLICGTGSCGVYGELDAGWRPVSDDSQFVFTRKASDIPEPSTLAILALGIIALTSRRFKKQS